MKAVVHNLVPVALMRIVWVGSDIAKLDNQWQAVFFVNTGMKLATCETLSISFSCRVESMQTKFACITCYTQWMVAALQRNFGQTM